MKRVHWVCWSFASLSLTAAAADLTESTFTQVVNDVNVVSVATRQSQKALINGVIKAPDLVRTGPNSRAELKAQDQTLTRIGANTIFSFDTQGRTINLQQGSVLFHSPTGRGGGTVKTGGAAAAVLGTTIMIVATPNGGFKGIVLEGRGKFTLPNGSSRNLNAGQLLFVLPGSRSFGPTLNINLSKMVSGSGLVKGYANELASLPKVEAAVSAQQAVIATGKMVDTGLLVADHATKDSVGVIDLGTFAAAVKENRNAIQKAADNDVDLDESGFPAAQVFHRSLAGKRFKDSAFKDVSLSYALIGQDITVASVGGGLHLTLPPPWQKDSPEPGEPRYFGVLAAETLNIKGDVEFHAPWVDGVQQSLGLVLDANDLKISDYASVRYDSPEDFRLGSQKTIKLRGVGVDNQAGPLQLRSFDGDIDMSGGHLTAANALEAVANDGDIKIGSATLTGATIRLQAEQLIEVRNVNLVRWGGSGYPTDAFVSMSANTIVLENVDLDPGGAGRPVSLKTKTGLMADGVNTRQAVVPGRANFYDGVKLNGTLVNDTHWNDIAHDRTSAQIQVTKISQSNP